MYVHVCMGYFNVAPSSLPPFLSSLSRLELLSTITEIRGYLRIEGWEDQTFPYLRNLRRVGSPNGTAENIFCNDGQQCEFSPFPLQPTKLKCLSTIFLPV